MSLLHGEYIPCPIVNKQGKVIRTVTRPYVWFMLKKNHQFTKPIGGIIDSGADDNLFPAGICVYLGLKLEAGIKEKITGIGKQTIIGYRHKNIELFFDNGFHFLTEIVFCDKLEARTILFGGHGFFDKFNRVTFDKKSEIIELEY